MSGPPVVGGEGASEPPQEALDLDNGGVVGRAGVLAGRDVGVAEGQHLVLDVVEDQQGVGEQKQAIVELQVVRGPHGQTLEEAHQVVADHAHRAADEARQRGRRHISVAPQQVREDMQRIAPAVLQGDGLRPGALSDGGRLALGAEDQQRVAAQERVAGQAFAALDGFQQERVGPPLRDLAEGGYGRLHVRQHLAPDGDQVAFFGLGGELLTGRVEHSWHEYT